MNAGHLKTRLFLILSTFLCFSEALSFQTPQVLPTKAILCNAVADFTKPNYIADVDNRLFARQELEYYQVVSDKDLKNLTELAKLIQSVKLNLITIPIPFKGSIYLTKSTTPDPRFDPVASQKIYNNQIAILQKLRIPTINLDALARSFPSTSDFFARRDHHWTGEAMEAAANQIAVLVEQLKPGLDQTSQTTLTRSVQSYGGSVADELSKACGFVYPQQEKRTFYSLDLKTNEGLLGSANQDVVIVGDSFSIPYFGFDKVVSNRLKTPIFNASINGGGCCASINGYFANLGPTDPKPKLVIWTALAVVVNSWETRELKPTIYHAYYKTIPLLEKSWPIKLNSPIISNYKLDPKSRYFIGLSFKGPKVESAEIQADYNNSAEKISFYRSNQDTKENYTTNYFYDLPENVSSIKKMTLNLKQSTGFTFRIYKYSQGTLK